MERTKERKRGWGVKTGGKGVVQAGTCLQVHTESGHCIEVVRGAPVPLCRSGGCGVVPLGVPVCASVCASERVYEHYFVLR